MKSSTLFRALQLVTSTCSLFAGVAYGQDEQSKAPILLLSEDSHFHFEILYGLSLSVNRGSDVGPVLKVAKNAIPGNMSSWTENWKQIAEETKARASNPEYAFSPQAVRDLWFSVATYYRRADVYLHGNPDDPRIIEFWNEQTAAFDKALAAIEVPGKRFTIPTPDFTIDAIWYAPSFDESVKRPTIIFGNGYDTSQEDLYHTVVSTALEHGYNCITYEGPGQVGVRRKQNLGFIPDWERVVTPVVDYVLNNKSDVVDPERLALFGNSLGGYLAARAAAFEPRIKALMVDGGVLDFHATFKTSAPELKALLDNSTKEVFDKAVLDMLKYDDVTTAMRWALEHGMWAFNTRSPWEFAQATKAFNLTDHASRIEMPMWIADASLEDNFIGQPQQVKDAVGDNAELHLFENEAGYHCQVGAHQEQVTVLYGWLNKIFQRM